MPIWELPHVAWKETKDGYEIKGYKGGRWYYKEQIEKLGLED